MGTKNVFQLKLNKIFSIVRVFAILSIVYAHVGTSLGSNGIIIKSITYSSTIGVSTFLIMSGYFFNTNNYKGLFDFTKGKLKSIMLPWLFLGTIGYLYKVIISNTSFSFNNLINWLLGNGTYLYYLTVLIICYYLFFYYKSKKFLLGAIFINIFSLLLTVFNLLDPLIKQLGITNYLNFFNWIGFFAIGILLKNVRPQDLYSVLKKSRLSITVIFIIITLIFAKFEVELGYFTAVGPFYELIGTWMFFSISTLKLFENQLFSLVSRYSFTVYLTHMIIVGILDDFYNKFEVLQFFSAAIVILISILIVYIGQILSQILHLEKFYYLLTGIRIRQIKSTKSL